MLQNNNSYKSADVKAQTNNAPKPDNIAGKNTADLYIFLLYVLHPRNKFLNKLSSVICCNYSLIEANLSRCFKKHLSQLRIKLP